MERRIGRTRQPPARVDREYDANLAEPRGIVIDAPPAGALRHTRRAPPDDLSPWIAHFWSVSWDLRGLSPHEAVTLPHPSVHFTIEAGKATVRGVHTGAFRQLLSGCDEVFGVKFKAGCFRPFLGRSVSELRNARLPARAVFGARVDDVARRVKSRVVKDEAAAIDLVADVLRRALPPADRTADVAYACVQQILGNAEIRSVQDLAATTGLTRRSLQRLFTDYVGVPVTSVIRRYRLHEVVAALRSGERLDWADIASQLGYFDQAHLINDFRRVVGETPARLGARLRNEGSQVSRRVLHAGLRKPKSPGGPPASRGR